MKSWICKIAMMVMLLLCVGKNVTEVRALSNLGMTTIHIPRLFCSNDDFQLTLQDKYCGNCGEDIEKSAYVYADVCMACGSFNDWGYPYCKECGASQKVMLADYLKFYNYDSLQEIITNNEIVSTYEVRVGCWIGISIIMLVCMFLSCRSGFRKKNYSILIEEKNV